MLNSSHHQIPNKKEENGALESEFVPSNQMEMNELNHCEFMLCSQFITEGWNCRTMGRLSSTLMNVRGCEYIEFATVTKITCYIKYYLC